ncbi:hypothetical protein RvY_19590, partial [Ramazzottius varieornatus]
MEAQRELETAFGNQGLTLPPKLLLFMEKASHGLEGREARFAIYRALCSQIFDVEQSMARAGPKSVLMYPPALLEYIRKIHGGEVAGGSGRGKIIVTLETIALMK